jgi:glycosyltransferase involved in cell wall biosynthesis
VKVCIDARYVRTTDTEVQPSGGIGRYVYQLLSAMLELDPALRLLLVVPEENGRPIVSGAHAARVEEHRFAPPAQSLRTLLSFPREALDANLFHFPANVLPLEAPGPAVTTVHDLMWLDEPKLCASSAIKRLVTGSYYRLGIEQAARGSAHVLTVSETSREALVRRYPELAGKVTVTHHGLEPFFREVDPSEAEALTAHLVPAGTPFVLSVGQGSPYKNHPRALRAFARAFADRPRMKLVLVRRFSRRDEAMRRLLASEELRDRVISLPEVGEEELRALYARASIFLFPSIFEGFGLPPLEAMACGTPVLTASFGAMREICGDAALGVNTYSVSEIADGLVRLERDQALRDELVTKGRVRAASFSWRTCAERTLAAYRQALAR